MKRRLATLLVLCLPAVTSLAQTFRGGIQGTVSDATGAAIPGAEVVATSVGTGLSRSQVTDTEGNYYFPELPLGEYTVRASLSGFKAANVKGVTVDATATRRVNLELSPGDVAESVEVVAA